MYYLVFRPQRRKVGEDRYQYEYRNQYFVGFTESFEEAVRAAADNRDSNFQIYETNEMTMNFRRREHTRYGFRRHYGMPVLYKRTPEGEETLIQNPLESPDEEAKRLEEIKTRRLEGVRRKIQQLNQVEQQIKTNPDGSSAEAQSS